LERYIMKHTLSSYRFAVKAIPGEASRPRELARTMLPHPLSFQELDHDPEYILYNGRLTPNRLTNATDDEMYWKVRREVILRHTGELPIEISGPDAEALLNRVFTRDVGRVRPGRCSYQFACYHDGGMITDGVLLRLSKDRFWMAQADGDLFNWYKAHAEGLDVRISDPDVWISQIQGPRALDVLDAVVDGAAPEPFRYFDCAEVRIAGQPCVISRSGFTNELGWEVYLLPDTDVRAIGEHILSVGEQYGMIITGTPVFQARRIEAGLLNAGSDFDATTTPFDAGLGAFVEFNNSDFVGRAALEAASRECRTWGMRVKGGVARLGWHIFKDGKVVGRVCSSSYSPYQDCGVCIVRMDDPIHGPGTKVEVTAMDDQRHGAELCTVPMYDTDRLIPRGKLVDIPDRPTKAV
jgi:glycine cleavage system aminomethyltransferase T